MPRTPYSPVIVGIEVTNTKVIHDDEIKMWVFDGND